MLRKILMSTLAAVTLALPVAPSEAVSSLAYTFVVDCANPNPTRSLVDMPAGNYLITVTGACSNNGDKTRTVYTSTCGLQGVPAHPCIPNSPAVAGAPAEVCNAGVGIVYYDTCEGPRGIWMPLCHWWYTILIDGKCIPNHNAGIVRHDHNGPMTAYYFDNNGDNTGAFVVTATWLAV